jgi:IS6 family transposase
MPAIDFIIVFPLTPPLTVEDGFGSFRTAWRTLRGFEVMHMIRKGQLHGIKRGDIIAQNLIIATVFGIAA